MGEPLRQSCATTILTAALVVNGGVKNISRVRSVDRDLAEFGARVLRARLEYGARQTPPRAVSQTEVGQAIGVSGVAVGQWEAGKRQPDVPTIQRLATVLGVRAGWLAFGEGPMREISPEEQERRTIVHHPMRAPHPEQDPKREPNSA